MVTVYRRCNLYILCWFRKHRPQTLPALGNHTLDVLSAAKQLLAEATLLAYRKVAAPLSIVMDASDAAVRAVLQQECRRTSSAPPILFPKAVTHGEAIQHLRL